MDGVCRPGVEAAQAHLNCAISSTDSVRSSLSSCACAERADGRPGAVATATTSCIKPEDADCVRRSTCLVQPCDQYRALQRLSAGD